MKISYSNLFDILEQRNITKTELRKKLNMSTATLAKLSKNEPVAMKVVDDIMETVNHFRSFDYMLDCASDLLTEDIVKHFHALLKSNTSDSLLEWFNVGEYKQRPNMAGDSKTTPPGKVKRKWRGCCLIIDKRNLLVSRILWNSITILNGFIHFRMESTV